MTNAARREQHSPHKGGSYAVPEPGVGSENSALKEAGKNRKEKKKKQNGFMHFLHNAPM